MGGRIKTVLIPYILWCSFYYIYYVAVTHIPAISHIMSSSGVVELSFTNWVNHIVINEYYTLWFLKNLLVFIALAPCIYLLMKNHTRAVPTGFVVLICYLTVSHLQCSNVIDMGFTLPSGLDVYLAGSYFGINHKEWICKANKKVSIIAMALVLVFFITSFKWFSAPLRVLFFISCWYALDMLTIKKTYWWMEITFFTYVAHDFFLEAFEKLYFMVNGHSPLSSLIDYLIMPFVVEALLIGIAFLIIKYLPGLWKFVCGGRIPELPSKTDPSVFGGIS